MTTQKYIFIIINKNNFKNISYCYGKFMKQKMLKIFWVLSVVFCIQTKEIDDLRSSKFQKELVHASECGNTKEVKHILDNYVIYNGAYDLEYYSTCNIALSEASRTYHTEIIKLLLVAGADADIKDNCGCTTLIWAVEKGHTKIAKLFITSGADVNAK
ncbi:MAG: ankyrin repeat domain-containing protein, partial [Bacteroidia bacterium]|nr:ankyrin repeat domain-containing protein [Bacteroidia bacterium]